MNLKWLKDMAKYYLPILVCIFASLAVEAQEIRSFDGSGNNVLNPAWGASETQLSRLSTISYNDLISEPAGSDRENPRVISNILFDQRDGIFDYKNLSDYVWVFGQFIDHDVSLVENFDFNAEPEELMTIVPPADDAFFSENEMIFMMRSKAASGTGTDINNPRQHSNSVSSFIDASMVYGSTEDRANWLRSLQDGKLRVSEGNLLPWNTYSGMFNDNVDPNAPFMADDTHSNIKMFVAGDIRANENPLLIAFHTLFVREHNRLCEQFKAENPAWTDEQLYQHARRWVIAMIQSIVYDEWLPSIGMGMPSYVGYRADIDPTISNVFSAAAFRLGHTLISSSIVRMKSDGSPHAGGSIRLKDAFFNPLTISFSGGIDPFLKGMGTQVQQNLDCKMIDDVRNFLFGVPGAGGLDLASINIARGRERGLPDYNTLRSDFGLPRVSSFEDICDDPEVNTALEELYETVDNIDPWVGLLAEDHMNGSIFGELVMNIIERQFRVLRDGDRFYFENDPGLSQEELNTIKETKFHDIIMRNTDIELMQLNVFSAMPHKDIPNGPVLEASNLTAGVYPNPVQGPYKVKVYVEEALDADVLLYNNQGILVYQDDWTLIEGENFFDMNMGEDNPVGFYNLMIRSKDRKYYTLIRIVRL
jgi:hypothetical protein